MENISIPEFAATLGKRRRRGWEKRRIWFLLHLFFASSGGFAFRHLTDPGPGPGGKDAVYILYLYAYKVNLWVFRRFRLRPNSRRSWWSSPPFRRHRRRRRFMNTWIYLTDICPGDASAFSGPTERGFFPFHPRNPRAAAVVTALAFDYGYSKTKLTFRPKPREGLERTGRKMSRVVKTTFLFFISHPSHWYQRNCCRSKCARDVRSGFRFFLLLIKYARRRLKCHAKGTGVRMGGGGIVVTAISLALVVVCEIRKRCPESPGRVRVRLPNWLGQKRLY